MSRARMISAGAALVAALAFVGSAPAFAGGAPSTGNAVESPFSALAANQLSTTQLNTARGGTNVDINKTTNELNVSATSSGTVWGSVDGLSANGAITGSSIENSTGFINQSINTGNNVEINSSMTVFINTTP
jgi:poly(3-hydroxybutyrate) depolymerase